MKIVYLIGCFPALSETFILNQITGMIDRGHDVRIFSLKRPENGVIHPDVEKYRLLEKTIYLPRAVDGRWVRRIQGALLLPWFCWHNPRLLNWFRSFLSLKGFLDIPICAMAKYYRNQDTFTVTHAQFGPLGAKLARLKMAGVIRGPLVTSFRGGDTTIILPKAPHTYDELFSSGDLFLTVSNFIRSRLIKHGCPEERVLIHHSGINLTELAYRGSTFPVGGPRVRLLCIAHLVEVKGVGYLLEAVEYLLRKGYKICLDIVGDGPLRSEYQEQIERSEISPNVQLHGYCAKPRVQEILRKADILVAPSVVGSDNAEEGMPNSIKEGMAVGVPVIATKTGGIPELIEDGVSGLLVMQKDAKALAEKLAYLIDTPDLWPKLAQAARKTVEQEFDIEKLNDRLAALYLRLAHDFDPIEKERTMTDNAAESLFTATDIGEQQKYYNERWTNRDYVSMTAFRRAGALFDLLSRTGIAHPQMLDFGCGSGWLAGALSAVGPVTAIDLSDEAIAKAKMRWPWINFQTGDALKVDLPKEGFDVIISQEVIEHVDDQAGYLKQAATFLKPGGFLIMTTPNALAFEKCDPEARARLPKDQPIENRLLKRELLGLLKRDFAIVCFGSTCLTPLPRLGPYRLNNGRIKRGVLRRIGLDSVWRAFWEKSGFGLHFHVLARKVER